MCLQGQAVAQLCSTIPNVTVFGTASSFKHEAIKDSVTHLFDRNADYVQEVKRYFCFSQVSVIYRLAKYHEKHWADRIYRKRLPC